MQAVEKYHTLDIFFRLSEIQFRWNFSVHKIVSVSEKVSDRTWVRKESIYFALRNKRFIVMLFSIYIERKQRRKTCTLNIKEKSKYILCIWRKIMGEMKKEGDKLWKKICSESLK